MRVVRYVASIVAATLCVLPAFHALDAEAADFSACPKQFNFWALSIHYRVFFDNIRFDGNNSQDLLPLRQAGVSFDLRPLVGRTYEQWTASDWDLLLRSMRAVLDLMGQSNAKRFFVRPETSDEQFDALRKQYVEKIAGVGCYARAATGNPQQKLPTQAVDASVDFFRQSVAIVSFSGGGAGVTLRNKTNESLDVLYCWSDLGEPGKSWTRGDVNNTCKKSGLRRITLAAGQTATVLEGSSIPESPPFAAGFFGASCPSTPDKPCQLAAKFYGDYGNKYFGDASNTASGRSIAQGVESRVVGASSDLNRPPKGSSPGSGSAAKSGGQPGSNKETPSPAVILAQGDKPASGGIPKQGSPAANDCIVIDNQSNSLAAFLVNKCGRRIWVQWFDEGHCGGASGCGDHVGPYKKSSITKVKGHVKMAACYDPERPRGPNLQRWTGGVFSCYEY